MDADDSEITKILHLADFNQLIVVNISNTDLYLYIEININNRMS